MPRTSPAAAWTGAPTGRRSLRCSRGYTRRRSRLAAGERRRRIPISDRTKVAAVIGAAAVKGPVSQMVELRRTPPGGGRQPLPRRTAPITRQGSWTAPRGLRAGIVAPNGTWATGDGAPGPLPSSPWRLGPRPALALRPFQPCWPLKLGMSHVERFRGAGPPPQVHRRIDPARTAATVGRLVPSEPDAPNRLPGGDRASRASDVRGAGAPAPAEQWVAGGPPKPSPTHRPPGPPGPAALSPAGTTIGNADDDQSHGRDRQPQCRAEALPLECVEIHAGSDQYAQRCDAQHAEQPVAAPHGPAPLACPPAPQAKAPDVHGHASALQAALHMRAGGRGGVRPHPSCSRPA